MPESSIVVRPEPHGSVFHTPSLRLQAAGLRPAIELFERAADEVPLPKPPQPVVIADYGASNGHNSLLPIGAAIARLRARIPPEQSILIAHTDIAENDFTALFHTLAEDPDSYLAKDPKVFSSAVGRSFYQQILPSDSVQLGWSSWAIQWLSRIPGPVEDHVHASMSTDEDLRAAYSRQAAEDWHEFIAFRGRELSPHGKLVVLTLGADESGGYGLIPLLDGLRAALAELVTEKALTAEELRAMSIPTVGRSEKDFVAPFAPKGRFENLSVEHLEVFDAGDRFWTQYRADGDAKAFGDRWAGFARAAVFPALTAALEDGPDEGRPVRFAEQLQQRLAERLAAAPEEMQIPMAKVVLAKGGHSP